MIDQWRTPTTFEQLKKTPGIVVDETPSAQLYHIELNTQRAPLSDIRVRRALALAFDYKTAIEQVFKGAALAKGPLPNRVYGHSEKVQAYAQNVEQAKKELADAASSRASSRSTTGSRPVTSSAGRSASSSSRTSPRSGSS